MRCIWRRPRCIRCQWWEADRRTERLAVAVLHGCDVQIFNDSLSVGGRVAKKTLRSCIVVVLAIEHVQRFEGRCIQADVKRATK